MSVDYDPEGPEPHEMDSDDEAGTIPCPHCRQEIAEEAEWCPKCGEYLSKEDSPLQRSLWIIITALALLAAGVFWLFFR